MNLERRVAERLKTEGSDKHLLFGCSVVSESTTPQTVACQASLSFTVSRSLLILKSIESMLPSNHLLLLPSIFPRIGSNIIRTFAVKEKRSEMEACKRGGDKYAGKTGRWREKLMNRREKEESLKHVHD